MADLREVFEMVKQQTEPDLDSWAEQERRMRRATQKRKAGAFALVAALIVGLAAVLVVSDLGDDERSAIPAADPSSAAPGIETGFAFIDLDGGEPIYTGIVAAGSGVDVSPDGTEIVYADVSEDGGSVHVANIDGSNIRAFDQTARAGEAVAPRWSPDGTKVVYQGKGPGNDVGNLYVLDVTTGRVTQITDLEPLTAGLYYMAPTFSPDGDTVLFTRPTDSVSGGDAGRSWSLWSVPATGGEPTLVRPNATGGDFAPSGEAIAYAAYSKVDGRFEFGDLYVARPDGTGARKLVEGSILLPRWSPDGSQIGYTDVEHNGLFVVDVETGETERVFESDEWASWVDENTMIVDLAD